MRRIELSKEWRPSWKAFGLMFAYCVGVNLVGTWIKQLLGFNSTPLAEVASASVALDKILVALNILAFLGFVALYLAAKWNNDFRPPQPHPMATRDFWVSAFLFIVGAFVITSFLRVIGVWTVPMSLGTDRGGSSGGALPLTVLLAFAFDKFKGEPRLLGVGFGLGAFLLITVCAM